MRYLATLLVSLILFGLLVLISASAQEAPKVQGTPGFKAVLNVYWVDIKSLDIVAENSYWFPTGDACGAAMPKAYAIAQEAANVGQEAILECKTVHWDGDTIKPSGAPLKGATDL